MSHSFELNTFLSLFNATAGVGGLPRWGPDLCFWVTHEDFLDLSRWDQISKLIQLTSVKKLKWSTLQRGFASSFSMKSILLNLFWAVPNFYPFLHDVKQWWKGNSIFMLLWETSIFCATQFAGNTKPWSIKLEIESVHWLFLFGTSKRRRFQIGSRIRFPQDTLENALTGLFAVESCDASYGFVGRINQFLIKPPTTLKKCLVLLKTFAQETTPDLSKC